jgi:hypothetical protein
MPRRLPPIEADDEEELLPEPTARPTELRRGDDEEDRLVPEGNVGGAAPTAAGLDSGGDLPGQEDDLANLAEPEPPDPPEVGAVHIRHNAGR